MKNELLNTYLFSADVLNDIECYSCRNLPECGGGCPDKRIQFDKGEWNEKPCSIFINNMSSFIIAYEEYKNSKK